MNPASRLLPIIEAALGRSGNENRAAKEWWSATFRTSDDQAVIDNQKLSSLLVAVCGQIDIMEDLLSERGVPETLYKSHFDKLREGFSPAMLNEKWAATKPKFSADVLVALQWAQWEAKAEEDVVSVEDIQALRVQIDALEDAIQADGIPTYLRRMLRKQVEDLRSSLDLYPICGIEPLRQAAKSAITEALIEKDTLAEASQVESSTPANAVKKFGDTLRKTIDTVNQAAITSRSISTLLTMGKSTAKLLFSEPGDTM